MTATPSSANLANTAKSAAATLTLSVEQRKALKAQAHHLDPVVSIGDAGLTANVVKEIDTALRAHELIKIRVHGDDREARVAMLSEILAQCQAALVQHIGKLLIVFREKTDAELSKRPKNRRSKTIELQRKQASAERDALRQADRKKVLAPRSAKVRGKLGERLSRNAMIDQPTRPERAPRPSTRVAAAPAAPVRRQAADRSTTGRPPARGTRKPGRG